MTLGSALPGWYQWRHGPQSSPRATLWSTLERAIRAISGGHRVASCAFAVLAESLPKCRAANPKSLGERSLTYPLGKRLGDDRLFDKLV